GSSTCSDSPVPILWPWFPASCELSSGHRVALRAAAFALQAGNCSAQGQPVAAQAEFENLAMRDFELQVLRWKLATLHFVLEALRPGAESALEDFAGGGDS